MKRVIDLTLDDAESDDENLFLQFVEDVKKHKPSVYGPPKILKRGYGRFEQGRLWKFNPLNVWIPCGCVVERHSENHVLRIESEACNNLPFFKVYQDDVLVCSGFIKDITRYWRHSKQSWWKFFGFTDYILFIGPLEQEERNYCEQRKAFNDFCDLLKNHPRLLM